jgi:hypothetical protein
MNFERQKSWQIHKAFKKLKKKFLYLKEEELPVGHVYILVVTMSTSKLHTDYQKVDKITENVLFVWPLLTAPQPTQGIS